MPDYVLPIIPLCRNFARNRASYQVHRVQYGTGGYSETPQGLIIEAFLTHAHLQDFKANRLPKVTRELLQCHSTAYRAVVTNCHGCKPTTIRQVCLVTLRGADIVFCYILASNGRNGSVSGNAECTVDYAFP